MTSCAACGSPLPAGRRHCPACGAGESQAAQLSGWDGDEDGASSPVEPASGYGEPVASAPGGADAGEETGVAGTGVVETVATETGAVAEHVTLPPRWPGVVLVAVGLALIGGGGYTAYRNAHGHRLELPPTVRTSPSTTPAPTRAPTHSPAPASPPSSAVASVPAPSQMVTVAPALVHQPDVDDIVETLTAYFTAINERDFETYQSVLVRRENAKDEHDFLDDFRSTTDSDVRLLGVQRGTEGELFATVAFRSTQDPIDAPDGVSPCLSWVLTCPMTRVEGMLRIDIVHRFNDTHHPC